MQPSKPLTRSEFHPLYTVATPEEEYQVEQDHLTYINILERLNLKADGLLEATIILTYKLYSTKYHPKVWVTFYEHLEKYDPAK